MTKPTILTAADQPPLQVIGEEFRVLVDDGSSGAQLEMFDVRGPRLTGPPPHTHPWEECYYVLEGALDVTLVDETTNVVAGQFVHIPENTPHCYRVASDDARWLIVTSPSGAAGFFREMDASIKSLPDDFAKMPEVAARHLVSVVGPPPG